MRKALKDAETERTIHDAIATTHQAFAERDSAKLNALFDNGLRQPGSKTVKL